MVVGATMWSTSWAESHVPPLVALALYAPSHVFSFQSVCLLGSALQQENFSRLHLYILGHLLGVRRLPRFAPRGLGRRAVSVWPRAGARITALPVVTL